MIWKISSGSTTCRLYSLETRHPLESIRYYRLFTWVRIELYNSVKYAGPFAGSLFSAVTADDKYPLVIAGGSCAMNPEPMSDFIDAFFVGEAEDAMPGIINTWHKYKQDRLELLRQLCRLPGIYVPRFYSPAYHADGTLTSLTPVDDECTG